MTVTLRPADIDDTQRVVEVFLACWRESYAAWLPPRLVTSMTDAAAVDLWSRVLGCGDRSDVVALDNGRVTGVVGFSAAGEVGTVHSLYVDPAAQGHGTGRTLLDHASAELARAGAATGRLWVFADNAPGVRFYASRGWLPDGTTRVEDAFGEPELRLSRVLVPAPSGVGG